MRDTCTYKIERWVKARGKLVVLLRSWNFVYPHRSISVKFLGHLFLYDEKLKLTCFINYLI